MTYHQMSGFILQNPITPNGVLVTYKDGKTFRGRLISMQYDKPMNEGNMWRFVPEEMEKDLSRTNSKAFTIVIDGDSVDKIEIL